MQFPNQVRQKNGELEKLSLSSHVTLYNTLHHTCALRKHNALPQRCCLKCLWSSSKPPLFPVDEHAVVVVTEACQLDQIIKGKGKVSLALQHMVEVAVALAVRTCPLVDWLIDWWDL
jgi:hypothetical protein